MATKRWLTVRWETLIPALEALGSAQEAEIQALCEEEIAAWRARPGITSPNALRGPMTDTRRRMKQLALTDENSYLNPRSGKREHLALKYMNFSEEEWRAMDAPSERALQQRLEGVKFLDDPEAIVAKARTLLQSKHWDDIVVGLAVTTGRRLSEMLKEGEILPKTRYTVLFKGQLKRRDKVLDPYEIPTLAPANLVLEAWQRLRQLLDCREVETEDISIKYGPLIKEVVIRQFADLVPARSRAEIYTHLLRTVYSRIAAHWYAPAEVVDLTYIATIEGHYWDLDETGEFKHDYNASLHYYDYRIGDGHNNIDGRQGIKLGQPGVVVLQVFQKHEEFAQGETAAKASRKIQEGLQVKKASKTGYSMLKPRQETQALVIRVGEEEGLRHHDDILQVLVKRHYLYRQFEDLLQPLGEQVGSEQLLEIAQALVRRFQEAPAEESAAAAAEPSEKDQLAALVAELYEGGVPDPVEYLHDVVKRDQNFRAGLAKRYSGLNFATMPLSQLAHLKTPEAAEERFRRAVQAIMQHNAACEEPLKRWYINQSAVHTLVGGRKNAIAEHLEAHKEEIEEHHQEYEITAAYNRKPFPITTMIHLPENPSDASASTTELLPHTEETPVSS